MRTEFNGTDEHWEKIRPAISELELGDLLEQIVRRYTAEASDTLEEAKALHARNKRNEDARKRSLSAKLLTTPNSSRISSSRAIILRELDAIRPLVFELLERIAKLELARIDLREYTDAEERVKRERCPPEDPRKLHQFTYDFVDTLFDNYRIDGSALSSLEIKDIEAIAEIVLQRHSKVAPELYT